MVITAMGCGYGYLQADCFFLSTNPLRFRFDIIPSKAAIPKMKSIPTIMITVLTICLFLLCLFIVESIYFHYF
jgi:hypothetical protein